MPLAGKGVLFRGEEAAGTQAGERVSSRVEKDRIYRLQWGSMRTELLTTQQASNSKSIVTYWQCCTLANLIVVS